MNRLYFFQIIFSSTCIICRSQVETHGYLFFYCLFSAIIWGAITIMTLIGWLSLTRCQLLQWAYTHLKRKGIYAFTCSINLLNLGFISYSMRKVTESFIRFTDLIKIFVRIFFYLVQSHLVNLKPRFHIPTSQLLLDSFSASKNHEIPFALVDFEILISTCLTNSKISRNICNQPINHSKDF
jgi:hypothetical protein